MHSTSYYEMEKLLREFLMELQYAQLVVAEIGSQRISAQPMSYRDLLPSNWKYIGIDFAPGDNVDLLMPAEYSIPLDTGTVDVVISGQCLEHCRNPFRLMTEAVRTLRPGGLAIVTAPACWPEHKYPLDCFRYYPDGMRSVLEEAGLKVERAYVGEKHTYVGGENPIGYDCWGVGRKVT